MCKTTLSHQKRYNSRSTLTILPLTLHISKVCIDGRNKRNIGKTKIHYDTEKINPEQLTGTDLEIIGRVVWSGQRM